MKSGRVCAAAGLLLAAGLAGAAMAQAPSSSTLEPSATEPSPTGASAASPSSGTADPAAARDQPLFGADADNPLTVKGPNEPDQAETVRGAEATIGRRPQVSADAGDPDAAQDANAPSARNPDGSPADPPRFVSSPNETQLLQAYPGLALRMRKSGKAVIRCAVDVQGALHDCRLLSETPAGMGFGQASLGLAHWYRLVPPLVDGRPASGMTVVIPMKWLVG